MVVTSEAHELSCFVITMLLTVFYVEYIKLILTHLMLFMHTLISAVLSLKMRQGNVNF